MRPRIRSIKPEFFQHTALFDAEREAGLPLRVAFAGLWCVADRAGRFGWRPRELKLHVLPYDDVDFERVLEALAGAGFIERYTVDGVPYGHIPGFARHQLVNNRERASELPAPPEHAASAVAGMGVTRGARVEDASSTRHDPAPVEGELEGEREREGSTALVELRSTQLPDTSGVELRTQERQTREAALRLGAEVTFKYWAARMGRTDSTRLDRKREARLVSRLRENGGDVSELLYAVDGALRDDWLMGRDAHAPRKYDGIETLFRDRAQVERLVGLAPGRNGQHPFLAQPHAGA